MARSNDAPHPGALFVAMLKEHGITIYACAKAISEPTRQLYALRDEQRAITARLALKLARYFNTTPEFWLHHQAAYELAQAVTKYASDSAGIVPLQAYPRP